MFGKMRLSTKILMLGVIITVCFTLVLLWIYPKVRTNMYEAKYIKTQNVVETACGVVDYYVKQAKSNAMPMEDAQKRAKEAVKNLKYGDDDYFWINDMQPKMIMHAAKPEMDGQDLSDYKDPNGKLIFVDFVNICKSNGAGLVEYVWPKPGSDKPVPKISYVKLIPEWGWIVGSGIYVDDVEKELTNLFIIVFGIAIIIIIGSLIFSYFVAKSISKPILNAVKNLSYGAEQIASASDQFTSTSQQLAEGSSEQAASIEETSSTLEESSSMIKQNAENTKQAAILAGQTKAAADKGNAEMQEMMVSMSEIKKSSDQIAKIIKVIDEIAFQTNILALNAAVEAARAGDAGMGFAVVAEEVRNLAQRSAQAAKDTASIIESNIELSDKGVNVAKMVGDSLADITQQAKKVNELMDEISTAGQEQTQGVMQINKAVVQMEKVTQQIAANAEESASASEELYAQAETMKEVVIQLAELINGKAAEISDRKSSENTQNINTKLANNNGKQRRNLTDKTNSRRTHLVKAEDIIPLENDSEDF